MFDVVINRGGFALGYGWGTIAPNLGLAPKCDMKHCLTNSKHQHIGAKGSVLWLSKYAKMRFGPGFHTGPRWGAHDALRTP